jgi:hypothetical protein
MTTYVIPYLGGDITRTLAGKSKTVVKESIMYRDRIHTDFVQYGAETGRFSSRNPNLQNVPAPHTKNGKAIRNLFIAPEGHKLIVADYSQIEPRIIASFSGDRVMVDAYKNGEDIYTTIGNTMGVDRKAGKVLVLSLAYGVGPDKIAKEIGDQYPEEVTALFGVNTIMGRAFASFPRGVQIKYSVFYRVIISLMNEPTPGLLKELLDRIEGKVQDKVDVTTDGKAINPVVIYIPDNGRDKRD